jgi:hypothetical protein
VAHFVIPIKPCIAVLSQSHWMHDYVYDECYLIYSLVCQICSKCANPGSLSLRSCSKSVSLDFALRSMYITSNVDSFFIGRQCVL